MDKYYRKFITQSGYLIGQQEILNCDVNLLFFQGIPDLTQKKVWKRLPVANQKISNLPEVNITLALLQQKFNDTDIEVAVGKIDLHELSDSEDFSDFNPETMPQLKLKVEKNVVWFDLKTVPAVPVTEPVPMTVIDLLNRHVEELAHEKQWLLQELTSSCNPSVNTAEQKCFICDSTYPHHLGIMNCPKTQNLINEGLAMYNLHG